MKRIPDTVSFALITLILSALTCTGLPAQGPPASNGSRSVTHTSTHKAATPALAKTKKATKSRSAKDGAKAPKAPKAEKAEKAEASKAKKSFEGTLNINTATAQEFDQLPRVSPKLAQRIVEYRQQHKMFRAVEELRNVKGFGAKMLETLKPHLTV
jgi:competence ComEA-like helix-hairpin-helix protein